MFLGGSCVMGRTTCQGSSDCFRCLSCCHAVSTVTAHRHSSVIAQSQHSHCHHRCHAVSTVTAHRHSSVIAQSQHSHCHHRCHAVSTVTADRHSSVIAQSQHNHCHHRCHAVAARIVTSPATSMAELTWAWFGCRPELPSARHPGHSDAHPQARVRRQPGEVLLYVF